MGRKRTPTSILKLRGSTTARLKAGDDIALPTDGIDAPQVLDEVARAEFVRVRDLLTPSGAMTAGDIAVLSIYAQTFARWMRAEHRVADEGETITTPNGSLQVSPWLSIARGAARDLHRLSAELGLSPTSRSKVSATKPTATTGSKSKYFKTPAIRA